MKLCEEQLSGRGWIDAEQVNAWRGEVTREVEEAVAMVQREPAPDPFEEDWFALSSRHLAETHAPEKIAERDGGDGK